jgi:hypothetical protein
MLICVFTRRCLLGCSKTLTTGKLVMTIGAPTS